MNHHPIYIFYKMLEAKSHGNSMVVLMIVCATCLYFIVIELNCVTAKTCCFMGCWRNARFAMAIWSTLVHAILAVDFIVSGLLAPSAPRILLGKKNQPNYQILFSILQFQMYFCFLKSCLSLSKVCAQNSGSFIENSPCLWYS
jgi:hypothetical protein